MQTLAEDFPSYATVKKWAVEFKRGRVSIEDDRWSGRPKTSTTDVQVDAIHHMVLDDRRLTKEQIAKTVDISSGSVHSVLSNILGMSKLFARWIPRMLTPEQKLKRADISRALLTRFQSDP